MAKTELPQYLADILDEFEDSEGRKVEKLTDKLTKITYAVLENHSTFISEKVNSTEQLEIDYKGEKYEIWFSQIKDQYDSSIVKRIKLQIQPSSPPGAEQDTIFSISNGDIFDNREDQVEEVEDLEKYIGIAEFIAALYEKPI